MRSATRTASALPRLAQRASLLMLAATFFASCAARTAPERPTWLDVEPIFRGQCTDCHGGSAPTAGAVQGLGYRLDFYDLTPEVCGDAVSAVDTAALFGGSFALGNAQRVADSITIDPNLPAPRPLMPPAPAPALQPWEWETIVRWAAETPVPEKGDVPVDNRAPVIRIERLDTRVDGSLTMALTLDDPDGQAAVGVVTIGTFTLKMDRPGRFVTVVDTSRWPEGIVPVESVVCDGWTRAQYSLAPVTIFHRHVF